jgi:hypothetical protein
LKPPSGSNEAQEQPRGALQAPGADHDQSEAEAQGTFTAQDLHFLKSLRISIAGEAQDAEGS